MRTSQSCSCAGILLLCLSCLVLDATDAMRVHDNVQLNGECLYTSAACCGLACALLG